MTVVLLNNPFLKLFDPLGNVIAEDGATYPVRYAYDTAGRRTSLSTTRDGTTWDTTTWAYDAATGNCLSKTYADNSTVTYTYTPDNLLLRTTYASGRWKENVYDERRKVVAVEYSDGETVSLAYDAFLNEIAFSNDVAAANLDRNVKGDCTNDTAVVGNESKTTRRTFDAFKRLTGIDGTIYDYNADGLLASISNDIALVEYAYTPDRLDAGYSLTLSNGVVFTRSLVRDGYRRSLVSGISSVANGTGVGTLAYTYDALSRPATRNNDTFGYNARSEVTAANVSGVPSTYGYDEIGNSTNWTANCLNQYLQFSHDLDGNMTQCGDWTYTYDAANRLKTVSSNGVLIVTNFYDAKSRRVKKVTPEATTTFFYDGWNIIEERIAYTNGTTSTIRYYWGKDLSCTLQGAGGVGGLLYLTIDGVPFVPDYDNIGNITRYLDANGNIVAQYTYDAFGNTLSQSGTRCGMFRHRFSTKYFDVETGLYNYSYRFYLTFLHRWLTRDPMGEQGGLNLYCFCKNEPTCSIDVHGCGRWNFNDSLPSGMEYDVSTSIIVTYEMDDTERKCCNQVTVKRYVRTLLTGGMVGPYLQDGKDEQSFSDGNKGYAPTDWPEGPGVRVPYTEIGYRVAWSWDFLFEAICTGGPDSGKILSTVRKFYRTVGHKNGADFPKGTFSDPPKDWPDLSHPEFPLR